MNNLRSRPAIAKSSLHVGLCKYNRKVFKVITIGRCPQNTFIPDKQSESTVVVAPR
jgi:hypothetical protein